MNNSPGQHSGASREQAAAEEQLRTSELRYRRLFEAAQDGILILDAQTGVIVDVNPFLIALLGYSRDVFIGKMVWELGFFKDIVANEANFRELQEKDYIRYDDLPLETIDGRRIDVEFVSNVYLVNEHKVIQCNIRDNTARKQAELKIRDALSEAQRFREALDHVSAFVYMKDTQGRYIYANRPTLEGFGCSATELVGCDDTRFFPSETVQRVREVDAQALRGESTTEEFTITNAAGERRIYWDLKAPLHAGPENQTIVGLMGISTDITERKRMEEALRDSELKFHSLYTSMTEGVALHELVFDATGQPVDYVLLDVNPAFELLTHLSRTAVVGRKASEAYGGQVPYLETFAEVALTGRPTRFETTFEPMKKTFTISVFSPAKGRFATVFADITDHKQAKNALRSSEAQFRAMFEMASIGMAQADPQTGQWLRVNQKMCAITGYSAAELIRMRIEEITHPEDRQRDMESFRRVVRGEMPDYRMEKRYLRKDGTVAWVNVNMTIIRDGPDQPTRTLATIEDITERKRAMESQVRLVTAVEQAAEAIVITDIKGTIEYVNPAFETITGYTRAEVIGQNPRILKSGKQGAEFYRAMWARLSAGQVWNGHFINKRKDGTLYEEDATLSPVLDAGGKIMNFVAVKRNVTHEVQLENQLRQAQKMEAVGRLAGGVAHDFNNLLMGIMGYTEICRDQIEPGHRAREWLDEITRCAERSIAITRQLLAFARKQTIAPKKLDLNDAVGGMLKLLRRLIGEDIDLVWQPGANLRPVRIDPSQVDQILANLCVNARDAIPGVGKITLETERFTMNAEYCAHHPESTPGEYVLLTVSDTGNGMDKETLTQIFEPFFTTKGLGKGTGLGLATIYGIVKQNNGFIYAFSEAGKGTTFKIYLPEIAEEAPETSVSAQAEPPKGQGETILLVEDENALRVTCRLFLEALGYEVLTAETPGEALKMADGHPGVIHLLLTDVIMPGMDGRQLANRLSMVKAGLKVLFMSGYTSDVIAKHGVLESGISFIAKPFTRNDLARKVREVLDLAKQPDHP